MICAHLSIQVLAADATINAFGERLRGHGVGCPELDRHVPGKRRLSRQRPLNAGDPEADRDHRRHAVDRRRCRVDPRDHDPNTEGARRRISYHFVVLGEVLVQPLIEVVEDLLDLVFLQIALALGVAIEHDRIEENSVVG
jgi:hypothetical protein